MLMVPTFVTALPKSPGPSPRSGILSMAKHIKEKQLVEDLFRDYDPSLRPVLRREDNVTVTLGISVHQIIDVVRSLTPRKYALLPCGNLVFESAVTAQNARIKGSFDSSYSHLLNVKT